VRVVSHVVVTVHTLQQAGFGQGALEGAGEKLDAAIAVHHRPGWELPLAYSYRQCPTDQPGRLLLAQ